MSPDAACHRSASSGIDNTRASESTKWAPFQCARRGRPLLQKLAHQPNRRCRYRRSAHHHHGDEVDKSHTQNSAHRHCSSFSSLYLCICNVFLYIMFLINNNNTTRCVWTEHTHLIIDHDDHAIRNRNRQHRRERERGRKDRQEVTSHDHRICDHPIHYTKQYRSLRE